MTSPLKILAICANARRSTGLTTPAGKTRVSRNALRHGFSRSPLRIGGFSGEVEALARKLACENARSERFEQACRIAAAQIDLVRVRMAKRDFFAEQSHRAVCRQRKGERQQFLQNKATERRVVSGRANDSNFCKTKPSGDGASNSTARHHPKQHVGRFLQNKANRQHK